MTLSMLTKFKRALFWMQTPLSLGAGICIYFSIPKSFTTSISGPKKQSIRQKLARIDYAGALLLVSFHSP